MTTTRPDAAHDAATATGAGATPHAPGRFDLDDTWAGPDLESQRGDLAARWLRGDGLEIGALHAPVALPAGARARYVDYKTLEENRRRYPELHDQAIVNTDIVDDGFILRNVAPESVDFLIANHALEHSPNPLDTLARWGSRLRPGGLLFVAVPIAGRCYDVGRPITSVEHFLADDEAFREADVERILATTLEHLVEFLAVSDRNIRVMNRMDFQGWREIHARAEELIGALDGEIRAALDRLGADAPVARKAEALATCHVEHLNKRYDLHYHTFSPRSYHALLARFAEDSGFRLEEVRKGSGIESIGVLRKI